MVKESLKLRPFAIVVAALALVMLIAACSDSGNADAISAVAADVSAQSAEIEALSAQVGELQARLADAQKMQSGEVAELRVAITEMSGQNIAPESFDDSSLRSDIGEVRALIAELQDRMDEDDQDDRRIDSKHLLNLDAQLMELGDTLAELKASMSGDEGAMDALALELGALRSELMALRDESAAIEIDDALGRLAWLETAAAPAITRAYVERAIRYYDANGRKATLDYYNTMDSVSGDLYLFVLDEDYKFIVHPTVPTNIGMDIRGPLGTDITGKNYGVEALTVDENGKWVDYIYLNPADNFDYERKHSWIVRHENLIFGSGWYEREVTLETDPAAYTRALVEQAVTRYDINGRDATVAYYNSPESVDGQWYVFIGDENDVMIAHAAVPENVGMPFNDIISPDGYPAGAQVVAAAVEGGRWTTNTYLNPATGNAETKHLWVVRHDGLIFASGWYEEGPPKSDAAAYAQSLVQRAVNLYDDLGRDGTVAYYNMPESVDGQFYVFILRAQDLRTFANGARPELVDIDPPARIDATGYAYGEAFAATTDEGHWVSYVFTNPATDELESKHTWIMEHDGLLFGSGWYAEPASYTQYLVNEAISMHESEGREATVAYYNSPDSVDGQWYVFAVDADDLSSIANPNLPDYVGTIPARIDPTGYYYGGELEAVTEEGKWISYVIRNPQTGVSQRKHTWVALNDGIIWGSGWYELIDSPKDEPALYVRSLVEDAIERYEADGHESTVEYYNTEESVDGEFYVFIGDKNDVMIAHATIPENVGKRHDEIVSTDGYPAGAQVAAAATEDGAWTSYTYINPAAGNVQTKHSWVIRHEGMIFGSGWYEDGPAKSEPADYAQSLVQRALNLYDDLGREGTLDYYNMPESADGPWYVFVLEDREGVLYSVANSNRPEIVGTTRERIDANGFNYGEATAAVTEEGGGEWISYLFTHPETREDALKHSWVVRRGNLLFGAGWYEGIEE